MKVRAGCKFGEFAVARRWRICVRFLQFSNALIDGVSIILETSIGACHEINHEINPVGISGLDDGGGSSCGSDHGAVDTRAAIG
jgi:hypothetical protein